MFAHGAALGRRNSRGGDHEAPVIRERHLPFQLGGAEAHLGDFALTAADDRRMILRTALGSHSEVGIEWPERSSVFNRTQVVRESGTRSAVLLEAQVLLQRIEGN